MQEGDVICNKYYPTPEYPYIKIAELDHERFTVDLLKEINSIVDCVGYAKIQGYKKRLWDKLSYEDIIPDDAIWVTTGCKVPVGLDIEDHWVGKNYPAIGNTVAWAIEEGYLFPGTDLYARCGRDKAKGPRQPRRLPLNPIFSKPLPLP